MNEPPDTVVRFVEPPVRLALPPVWMVRSFKLIFEENDPPVTFDRPVTFPPVRVVVPFVVRELRLPPARFNIEDEMVEPVTDPPVIFTVPFWSSSSFNVALLMNVPPVTVMAFAEPPVRLTDPFPTVRFPSVILDSKVPPVIFDRPLTLPPVREVVPFEMRLFKVPPVRFKIAEEVVVSVTAPPMILAVPFCTSS